ncbi:MAG TPA: ATP-binding protein, partial [Saprospiraceae bacterium]|nr:ATP-binding protein [Saprospiraceae bacterium]
LGKNPDLYYYYYDKNDGFLTNEFNGGCQSPAIKLRDGRFSFSSMDGLVQFDPMKIKPLFPIHTFKIENMWLDGTPISPISDKLVVDHPIQELKLKLSTTFYGHPDNLLFEYKIEHLLGHWKTVASDNFVVIQNLPKGNYEVTIRKRTGFGNDSFDYIKIKITVQPYFYQTWWFKVFLLTFGALMSYLFSRWYNRYTIQKNKELETLIEEKNEGLIQSNKTLKEKIKQNDLFQSILVHDIKSPLRFIASNTKILLDFWATIDDDVKKENLLHIHESASKIRSFVEETLLWIHIRNGEHEAEAMPFKIYDLLKENAILYNEDTKIVTKKIMVDVICDPTLTIHSDRSLISTIIRNLFTNSIKYTDEGKITLYAYQEENGKVCIGCKDEGRGLSDVMVDAILSDDYKGNSIRKDSFRMGYVIIKEIVRLLNAKLIIKSADDKGSDVCIEFKTF